jgi:hypothetical protein
VSAAIPIYLDGLYTRDEAAQWLRMAPRKLAELSRGRRPRIPSVRISNKIVLYHPRTILAKYAEDQGVKPATIAASFSTTYIQGHVLPFMSGTPSQFMASGAKNNETPTGPMLAAPFKQQP